MDAKTARNIAIGQERKNKSDIEYALKLRIVERLNRMVGSVWNNIVKNKEENDKEKTDKAKEKEKLIIDIERMIMDME